MGAGRLAPDRNHLRRRAALEATRLNLNDALKEGGKGAGGQSARSQRLRGALVVAEVAMALVLLASAGLMVKSFARLQKIDTGFDTENVLTMVVSLPAAKYREDHQMVALLPPCDGAHPGAARRPLRRDGELPAPLRGARLLYRLHH